MRRVLKYLCLSVAALVIMMIALFAFIVGTETGTRLAWNQADRFMPDGLRVESIEGRLIGPLVVRGVDLHTDTFRVSLDTFELRSSPAQLLSQGTLDIDLLALRGLRYTQQGKAAPEPKKEPDQVNLPECIELPLSVRLTARLHDFHYRAKPHARPLVIDRADLMATFANSHLAIERLEVDAPLLTLEGAAQLAASGPYALDGEFRWQGRPPDYPPVDGRTTVGGSLLKQLTIDQTLAAPYRGEAEVKLSDLLKGLRFDAALDLEGIELKALQAGLPPVTLKAELSARGTPDDMQLNANVRAHEPRYGTLDAVLVGGFTNEIVRIDKLILSSQEQPARLNASGQIALNSVQPAAHLKARWQHLRWPLSGRAAVESSDGHVNIDGDTKKLRAGLSATLAGSALAQAGIKAEQRVEASFDGGFSEQTLAIDDFTLSIAQQRLAAKGRVILADEQPRLDIQAAWKGLRWPLAGAAMIESSEGRLKAQGDMEALRAELTAALSGVAFSKAGIKEKQTVEANFSGGFAEQTLTIDRFWLKLAEQPAALTAAGRVALTGKLPRLDVNLAWQALSWPLAGEPVLTSPRGKLSVKGTPGDLQAELTAGVGEKGTIEGSAVRAGERIDVAIDWRELRWPPNEPQVISPTGGVTVTGGLEDYQVRANARVEVPEHTEARLSVAGNGSLEFLNLTGIDLEALQGRLTGTAHVGWKPALQGSVALEGEGLNPGDLLAEWPGRLGLNLRAEAGMPDKQPVARVEQLHVNGRLRGYDLDLRARGDYDGQGFRLGKFALVSGRSEFDADGLIGDTLDVDWRMKSPDLGQLLPDTVGRLTGQGSAQGPLRRPQLTVQLTGAGLRYEDFSVQSVDLDADVDLTGKTRSRLEFALENGAAGDIALNRIELNGAGNLVAHSFDFTARTGSGSADVALSGGLENPWQQDMLWRFQFDEATLKYPRLGPWRIRAPVGGLLSAERAHLSRGCWVSGEAHICMQGERSAAGVHADVEIDALAFGYFRRLLPPRTRVEGSLKGRAKIDQAVGGQLAASAHLETTPGRVASAPVGATRGGLQTGASRRGLTLMAFRSNEIDFALGEQGMRLNGALRLLKQGGVEIGASVPPGQAPLRERPLDGAIIANIPDLSSIAQLVPDMGRFEGRLQGDIQLSGMLQTPEIRGRLALLDASTVLNAPGLEINGLRVALIGKGAGGVQLDAVARSGGGTLNVVGNFELADPQSSRADIRIRGQAFQVFNTADARVFASPDLALKASADRVSITGEVGIPRAEITPKKLPESAVTVADDQVILEPGEGDSETEESVGPEVHARVRLVLGAQARDEVSADITDKLDETKVHVEAFGLTAGLDGELLVIEEPGEPTTGAGEISIVDGTYQAYGQNLIIKTGRVLFPGGPIDEPGLDVRALRGDLDPGVRVGVHVRGSLKQPDFTLFSVPPMTQQEQLSYLVLGRAPGESSGGASSLLAQAALALGLKGGNYLAENIGSKLGVDEIGFESKDTGQGQGEQASLVIGKYLSPKLYVSYGIGLLEPISTVRLEYVISNQWHLVTESSGAESGGDIIYTVE